MSRIKRITEQTRPFAAIYRGVPVVMALFLGVTDLGLPVQGMAAEYPDGTRVVAIVPSPIDPA